MRWLVSKPPKKGDVRIVNRFAFFPKRIPHLSTSVEDRMVWLENYYERQMYVDGGWDELPYWKTVSLEL